MKTVMVSSMRGSLVTSLKGASRGRLAAVRAPCGQGIETCVLGAYADCNAPLPEAEQCDAVDNDCDGSVDEDTERGETCSLTSPGCAGEFPCLRL